MPLTWGIVIKRSVEAIQKAGKNHDLILAGSMPQSQAANMRGHHENRCGGYRMAE